MNDLEREIFREGQRRNKLRMFASKGFPKPACVICGLDDPLCLELDHVAGQHHDDQRVPICKNHHAIRTTLQREEPPGGDDPRNPLEVIGRWLLGIAQYFEMLVVFLHKFGGFLISTARNGYGEGLTFDPV